MVRSPAARRWIYGAAYAAAAAGILLFHILPTDLGPDGYPGPDLLLCLTIVWVLRRPHYAPTPLIAAVFLLADVLFMRPPGLWTALVVLAVEYLRAREAHLRELPLAAELGIVSFVVVALHLLNYLVLVLFGVPHAVLSLTLLQMVATLIAYPMVLVLARVVFRVHRMTPAEVEAARRPG